MTLKEYQQRDNHLAKKLQRKMQIDGAA